MITHRSYQKSKSKIIYSLLLIDSTLCCFPFQMWNPPTSSLISKEISNYATLALVANWLTPLRKLEMLDVNHTWRYVLDLTTLLIIKYYNFSNKRHMYYMSMYIYTGWSEVWLILMVTVRYIELAAELNSLSKSIGHKGSSCQSHSSKRHFHFHKIKGYSKLCLRWTPLRVALAACCGEVCVLSKSLVTEKQMKFS